MTWSPEARAAAAAARKAHEYGHIKPSELRAHAINLDEPRTPGSRIGDHITVHHMAWGDITGNVVTIHKNGKGGTLNVAGHPSPIAFKNKDIKR